MNWTPTVAPTISMVVMTTCQRIKKKKASNIIKDLKQHIIV